jgi:uncharacterized protein (DUF1697 family)
MRYAAFFRGLNVGGKNRIKMADLRKMLLDCGFQNVASYIQSGNVIFETNENPEKLNEKITHCFSERFGFESPVVLRSAEALSALLANLPFSEEEIDQAKAKNPDVQHLYVYLADRDINPAAVKALTSTYAGEDQLRARRQEIILLCTDSVRHSKLETALNKLDIPLTARNLKTLTKMQALLAA